MSGGPPPGSAPHAAHQSVPTGGHSCFLVLPRTPFFVQMNANMKALIFLLLSIPLFQHAAAQAPGKPSATDTSPAAAKTDTQRLKDVVVRGKRPLFQQQ